MDKKSIIGLVLIIGIFVGYMFWISPSKEEIAAKRAEDSIRYAAYLDSVKTAEALAAKQDSLAALMAAGDSAALEQNDLQKKESLGTFGAHECGVKKALTVHNSTMTVALSSMGASVQNVVLADYLTYDSLPLQLISAAEDNMNLVFSTEDNRTIQTKDINFEAFVNGEVAESEEIEVGEDTVEVAFRAYADSAKKQYLEFVYTFSPNSYGVDFDINFHGLTNVVRKTPYMDFTWQNRMNRQEKVDQSAKGSRNRNKDVEKFYSNVYFKPVKDKVDNLKMGLDAQKQVKTAVEWVAFKQQYFCAILTADSTFENADLATVSNKKDTTKNYLCNMASTVGLTYNGDKDCTMGMGFYFGPNKYRDLRNMHQGFERMLPLGWGFFLVQWVCRYVIIPGFNFLEKFNWNYGIIIIVLTFLIRLVLFPLTFKSYQGTAILRIIKPEMDALAKKFPNPDQAMQKQQAQMALQKKAGYSPMAGCLPLLLQMPILYAMFRFFPSSIELRQKGFLWCDDLSTYDSVLDFGFNIPLYGDHLSLFCLLMFGVQFFYTWYTMRGQSTQGMPGMKFIMYFTPFMMLFLFNSQSAALNLYYFFSLSLTMLQMILIRKFTSEKKVRARLAMPDIKSNKPQKKSKFQKRLEEMQKMTEEMQKQQRR